MMKNSERFLNAYAAIEKAMSGLLKAHGYIPFSRMIDLCSRFNRTVRSCQENLREYNELRNAIVHQRGSDQEVIAEPSDAVTADIEHIAGLLNQDDSIMGFASAPVRSAKPEDAITDAYALMKAMGSSKLPVYTDGKFAGLVTMETIAEWGVTHSPKEKVADILSTDDGRQRILFLGRDASVQAAVEAYENAMAKGQRLLAILITEHGSTEEKPLGIITLYDLPKILAKLV